MFFLLNSITLEIYVGRSTARRTGLAELLALATGLTYETYFPNGRYGALRFRLPIDTSYPRYFKGGDRLVACNGLDIVFEGAISFIGYVQEAHTQGLEVTAVGAWGGLLAKRATDKRWADSRTDSGVWQLQETVGADKCGLTRDGRVAYVPKAVEWVNGDYIAVRYTMPTGQTTKRVAFNYNFSELAQDSPKKVFHFDSAGPAYTDIPNTVDGSPGTSHTVTMTTGDYLYIDLLDGTDFNGVYIDFGGTVNGNTAVLSAQYGQVDTAGNETYTSLSITDGTASGGRTFAQDGLISFTRPNDVAVTNVNSNRRAWLRLSVSANLTANVVINEIYLRKTQNWKLSLYNVGTGSEVVTVTTTGAGSINHPLATPSQAIELRLVSLAKQTPPSNGSIFAEFSAITVYSETGSITLTEVVKDGIGAVTDLNSTELLVGSNTLSIEPFISNGRELWASILSRAAAYGDASGSQWHPYTAHSELAPAINGKPVLGLEQYPSLSDYDYAIRLDEENIIPPVDVELDHDRIANWIAVRFRDAANDRDVIVTPDDDASLKDQASIDKYGQRELPSPLDIGVGTQTTAVARGVEYLNRYKRPQLSINAPINVRGYIRSKGGLPVPAANIIAGKRLKIENYLTDEVDVDGAGLTEIVYHTAYRDSDETCGIGVGRPDFAAQVRPPGVVGPGDYFGND